MKEVKPPKKSIFSYYCIALLIIILFNSFVYPRLVKTQIKSVDYGTFLDMLDEKNVKEVEIEDEQIVNLHFFYIDRKSTRLNSSH